MTTFSPAFRTRVFTGLIIMFAAATTAFAQTQRLTFDELAPSTRLNGLSFSGVTFTFTIGGVGSTDATYNEINGPPAAAFLQLPVAEGNAAGTLTMEFETPTTVLEFGIARSTLSPLNPGVVVQLFDSDGTLFQTIAVALTNPIANAEAQFKYAGRQVKRAVLTFPDVSAARWALDNLVFQSGSTGGPGLAFPASAVSDQKAGSVLFFNYYTSSPTAPASVNSRIAITNTNEDRGIYVHLFFVDGTTCSIADRYACLTKSQTMTFLASEQDPGITGYIVAVAVSYRGCPVNFNYLIGDEYVKLQTGEFGNIGAESIAAIGALPSTCDPSSVTTRLAFDGSSYNLVPRVLSLSNIPSRVDGVVTRIVVNRIGGNLGTGAGTIGTIFGILYNDQEQAHSFNIPSSGCQRSGQLDDDFPRTTPRFRQVIPAGQSGWLKLWAVDDVGIAGAALTGVPNAQAAAGTFNGSHNLHKLRLTSASVTIPIFPPGC